MLQATYCLQFMAFQFEMTVTVVRDVLISYQHLTTSRITSLGFCIYWAVPYQEFRQVEMS